MNKVISPLNRGLLITLIVVVAFIPKIFSSIHEVNDPFIYPQLAVTQLSLNQNHLVTHPFEPKGGTLQYGANGASEKMATVSMLATICRITGLSPKAIHTLPLNGILLFMLGYALAKRLLKSKWLALAFALFISYEPVTNSLANTSFSIGWGYTLYFTFILLMIKILEQKSLAVRLIPLLLLTFVTTYLTYYTAEVYMIILSVGLTLLLLLTDRRILRVESLRKYPNPASLSMAFVIVFMAFDSIFYSYLKQVHLANLGEFIKGYVGYVSGALTGGASTGVQNATVGRFALYSGTVVYISLAVPILLYLARLAVAFIKKVHDSENIRVDLRLLIFWVLIATGVINLLIYASLHVMGYKYILLIFPLLAFYSLEHLQMAQMKRLATVTFIVILCITKFSAYCLDENIGYADEYYSYMNPTAVWVSNNVDEGDLLTDVEIGGNLLLGAVQMGKANQIYMHVFSDYNVGFLGRDNMAEANVVFQRWGYDYLVISHKYGTRSVVGANWLDVRLSGKVSQCLDSYSGFHKVFDDGQGIVYKFDGGS